MQEVVLVVCAVAGVATAMLLRRRNGRGSPGPYTEKDRLSSERDILLKSISKLEEDPGYAAERKALLPSYRNRLREIEAALAGEARPKSAKKEDVAAGGAVAAGGLADEAEPAKAEMGEAEVSPESAVAGDTAVDARDDLVVEVVEGPVEAEAVVEAVEGEIVPEGVEVEAVEGPVEAEAVVEAVEGEIVPEGVEVEAVEGPVEAEAVVEAVEGEIVPEGVEGPRWRLSRGRWRPRRWSRLALPPNRWQPMTSRISNRSWTCPRSRVQAPRRYKKPAKPPQLLQRQASRTGRSRPNPRMLPPSPRRSSPARPRKRAPAISQTPEPAPTATRMMAWIRTRIIWIRSRGT